MCSCFIEFIKQDGEKGQNVRLRELLSLFRSEFDKLNNTGALMLYSIYHMTFK